MTRFAGILATLLLASLCFAQPYVTWNAVYDTLECGDLNHAFATEDGCIIGVGWADDPNVDMKGLLVKYAPDGTLLAHQLISGSNRIELFDCCPSATNPDEYVAIGSRHQSGSNPFVFVRFTADLTTVETTVVGSFSFSAETVSITVVPDEGYIVTSTGAAFPDPIILKMDETYDVLWHYLPGETHVPMKSVVNADGDIVIAGTSDAIWTMKLSADGELLSQQLIGRDSYHHVTDMRLADNGDYIIVGYTEIDSYNQPFFVRYSSDGTLRQLHYYPDDEQEDIYCMSIFPASGGGYYLGGSTWTDPWLASVDETGTLIHDTIFESPTFQRMNCWGQTGERLFFAVGGSSPGGVFQATTIRFDDVNLTLGPTVSDIAIPDSGGTVEFDATFINSTEQGRVADVWVKIDKVIGEASATTAFYPNVLFAANSSRTESFEQQIPASAAGGYYVLTVFTGHYPEPSAFRDQIRFFKIDNNIDPYIKSLDGSNGWDCWSTLDEINTEPPSSGLPAQFTLQPAYPNPFNPATTISLELPSTSDLNLRVFNMAGQLVADLAGGEFPAGSHEFTFDGNKLASGIYLVQASSGSWIATQKIVLLK